MALEPTKGVPAKLETRSRVLEVDAENATITLENGQTVQGDLVIGADGVHVSHFSPAVISLLPFLIYLANADNFQSKCRAQIPGGNVKPFGSGKSAFRFLIPRKTLQEDPETKDFVENEGILIMFIGDDRRFVMYPCSNNELLNFVVIHPSSESEASDGELPLQSVDG